MAFFHAATHDELCNLRAFDGTYLEIEPLLRDNQEILTNWLLLEVQPHAGRQRVVLVERSSLAVAWIVGDGVHFGRAESPDADFVSTIAARFRERTV